MEKIKVTVICMAYNHEKYIEQCLLGFANQKTDFGFRVIVHDDASTDNSQEIIKSIAEKYPDIFVTILQTKNQYSNGGSTKEYIDPLIEGDYIAQCEGDDYWDDPLKLQRQVDYLDQHPEYSACVHNTKIIDMSTQEERLLNQSREDYDIPIESIISRGGAVFHTSSVMCRRGFYEVPCGFGVPGIGDYPQAVYLALCGKIRFLKQVMSVYRYGTAGSWTKRQTNSSLINTYNGVVTMLNNANEYSNFKYNAAFSAAIIYHEYLINILKCDYFSVRKKYADLYKKESPKFKFKFIAKCILKTLHLYS